MAKYRIRVETQLDPTPPAMANGNQIQQVLLNLLINARQAMPNGGTIIIKLNYDAARTLIDLVVRDTGSGMPPDVLHRIFDPYFSTKAGPDATGKGGTGLGLCACRDIIEAHKRPHPRRKHRRPRHGVHHQTARGAHCAVSPAPATAPAVSVSASQPPVGT